MTLSVGQQELDARACHPCWRVCCSTSCSGSPCHADGRLCVIQQAYSVTCCWQVLQAFPPISIIVCLHEIKLKRPTVTSAEMVIWGASRPASCAHIYPRCEHGLGRPWRAPVMCRPVHGLRSISACHPHLQWPGDLLCASCWS